MKPEPAEQEAPPRRVLVSTIQREVAAEFEQPLWIMREPGGRNTHCRRYERSHPRQCAMLLARQLTGHSHRRIGDFFGGRDHSTVKKGIDRAQSRIAADPDLAAKVEAVRERVG